MIMEDEWEKAREGDAWFDYMCPTTVHVIRFKANESLNLIDFEFSSSKGKNYRLLLDEDTVRDMHEALGECIARFRYWNM